VERRGGGEGRTVERDAAASGLRKGKMLMVGGIESRIHCLHLLVALVA